MNIVRERQANVDVFRVVGRIDSTTAPDLDGALHTAADGANPRIVIDLSPAEYISSAGLRALVSAAKAARRNGGDVRIAQPSERVSEVLKLAGLESIFSLHGDVAGAVASYATGAA
ncbi:MAG: STAS domain-containing protein [Anaerolineales bacterium]|nr:STAS domain-containing protein [Anaerolineales bacterium]